MSYLRQGEKMRYRFALSHDDSGKELGRFADMVGLFENRQSASSSWRGRISCEGGELQGQLLAIAESKNARRQLGNVWAEVLDDAGVAMGQYYLANVDVESSELSTRHEKLWDVHLTGSALTPPHPNARGLWEMWATNPPDKVNAWANLSIDEQVAWLEVARLRRCSKPPTTDTAPGSVFAFDATHVKHRTAFLCALGEAINGPGGYFGANLDSLRDCLAGGFGARSPFVLRWQREESADQTPSTVSIVGLEDLVDVLIAAKVSIVFAEK